MGVRRGLTIMMAVCAIITCGRREHLMNSAGVNTGARSPSEL